MDFLLERIDMSFFYIHCQ